MNYLNNIKELIEKEIVLRKKHRLQEENNRLKTYFEIGRQIVEAQGGERRAKYGNGLIREWSIELTRVYGKGYDYTNLSRMRKFYIYFKKVGTVCQYLTWSHLRYTLPIKDSNKRNYYINLCIKQNLSIRQLIEKIKSNEYERLEYKDKIEIINNTNESLTIKDMIKNPMIINTNKNTDKLSEKALKSFILDSIERFLLELGVGFTYVGSEYKLGKYRYDLLFFNYELNSFIVIELKTRELRPTDIGQINYYMKYIDNNIKKEYMSETIGIIMSKEENEIIIKYITDDRILFTTYEINNT